MRILRLSITALTLGALAFAFGAPATATTTAISIKMKALNKSGETGTATLTQLQPDGVKIVVTLKNAPTAAQPTHIHIGTCGNINKAPEYGLVSLANGTSTSILKGVTLDQLLKGTYAINVHKSTDDLGTYVSCGNIKSS